MEIEIFKPREYWSVKSLLKTPRGKEFESSLRILGGKKLDKLFVTSSQKEILKLSNRKNYSYIFNIKNIGNDTKRFKNY